MRRRGDRSDGGEDVRLGPGNQGRHRDCQRRSRGWRGRRRNHGRQRGRGRIRPRYRRSRGWASKRSRRDGRSDAGTPYRGDRGGTPPSFGSSTTIGVVATNATLTKEEANKLASIAHDGLALAVRPAHTMRDGDTIFAVATGREPGKADMLRLGAATVACVGRAIARGVRCATGLEGIPSVHDLAATT